MRQLKKRTIALVLASVVTVAGAFGAENYKNRVMSLDFKMSGNHVDMTVQTRSAYSGSVSLRKQNENTYVMILPEFDKANFTTDIKNVSHGIESVSTTTMPYTTNGNGYTKITVKTHNPAVSLSARSVLYLPDRNSDSRRAYTTEETEADIVKKPVARGSIPMNEQVDALNNRRMSEQEQVEVDNSFEDADTKPKNKQPEVVETAPKPVAPAPVPEESNSFDFSIVLLSIFLGVLIFAFLYLRAKGKMTDMVGDTPPEVEDETSKKKSIRKTIKKLDKTYTNPPVMPAETFIQSAPVETVDSSEELEIVDLDKMFKDEAKAPIEEDEEENAALEEFLSGFSFDDDEIVEQPQELGFDEDLYNQIINSEMSFTKEDSACINQLLNTEINGDTLRNIDKYAISNPVKKTLSKQEILEELTTTYAISQNIIFTEEDTEILKKLISVELDDDFITDLRTNPDRVKQIQEEAAQPAEVQRKPKEILTLNVKDMLPDLSAALKAQGGRKIESNFKPETVYFSEGYEVSTLSLNEALPDLSSELNNKDAYVAKPSADIEYVDTNYDVQVLNISNELPDLKDVMEHPDKYKEPEPEIFIPDEEALLRNIDNVKLKAFYDGFESEEETYAPAEDISVSDIQKEFSEFGIEIGGDSYDDNIQPDEYDDNSNIYNNEYVDLDEQKAEFGNEEASTSEELIRRIEASKIEREKIKARLEQEKLARMSTFTKSMETVEKPANNEQGVCVFEGKTYTIVSTAPMTDTAGCYLVKNEYGYTVLGYSGENLTKIKYYSDLKSERIQARLNDTMENGSARYLIRIGVNKFIVDVNNDRVRYVMDLC